jgi:hypothetical protein
MLALTKPMQIDMFLNAYSKQGRKNEIVITEHHPIKEHQKTVK